MTDKTSGLTWRDRLLKNAPAVMMVVGSFYIIRLTLVVIDEKNPQLCRCVARGRDQAVSGDCVPPVVLART